MASRRRPVERFGARSRVMRGRDIPERTLPKLARRTDDPGEACEDRVAASPAVAIAAPVAALGVVEGSTVASGPASCFGLSGCIPSPIAAVFRALVDSLVIVLSACSGV